MHDLQISVQPLRTPCRYPLSNKFFFIIYELKKLIFFPASKNDYEQKSQLVYCLIYCNKECIVFCANNNNWTQIMHIKQGKYRNWFIYHNINGTFSIICMTQKLFFADSQPIHTDNGKYQRKLIEFFGW